MFVRVTGEAKTRFKSAFETVGEGNRSRTTSSYYLARISIGKQSHSHVGVAGCACACVVPIFQVWNPVFALCVYALGFEASIPV